MSEARKPVTVPALRSWKRRNGDTPIVMVTAYDEPGARIVSDAGADIILVGDSVANNVLGYPDTLHVDIDVMAHHTAAVARAAAALPDPRRHALDELSPLAGRGRAQRGHAYPAGAQAVKLEGGGGAPRGGGGHHPGRDPGHGAPRPHAPVGARHGRLPRAGQERRHAASALLDAAKALAAAGCFGFVIEGVPDVVGAAVTEHIDVPTIGIGAGPSCDGQVLVFHDLLGLGKGTPPKFVRQYADVGRIATEAIAAFADDVRSGNFPADAETYHAPAGLGDALG